MPDALDDLATSHGIQTRYVSELGEAVEIPDAAKRALLSLLGVDPRDGAPGDFSSRQQEATRRCALPADVRAYRPWGLTCQLYGLRSARSIGIGDFEDLARLAEVAAATGAAFLGVSPLHALFHADPDRSSPYSPSTRRFLNPLFIAVDRLAGGVQAIQVLRDEDGAAFAGLEDELVDYRAAASVKFRLLRRLFDVSDDRDAGASDGFEAFRRDDGDALHAFALFEAISAHEVAEGGHAGWHRWPGDLHDRRGDAVARFETAHPDEIRFHEWLQFIADRQLGEAQDRARAAGMPIGLYLDVAVGVAPDGADTWADPELTVRDARVGSPPDLFNAEGQDWGLAPLSPRALAVRGYLPLADACEASMRHAGAIRIDHAMGLARLWWIPASGKPADGGYVRYPLGAMVDTVATVSQANDCIVVGEDLGTVPEGFDSTMEAAGLLSYRVLYFERGTDGFVAPADYPELALACIGTHDLATLRGWWHATDITLRAATGRQTDEATARDLQDRERDRRMLLAALAREGLLPASYAEVVSGRRPLPGQLDDDLAVAIHRFASRTRSVLFAVQLEDAVFSERQRNLPGTVGVYPNWRLRYEVPLEALATDPHFQAIVAAVREERSSQGDVQAPAG